MNHEHDLKLRQSIVGALLTVGLGTAACTAVTHGQHHNTPSSPVSSLKRAQLPTGGSTMEAPQPHRSSQPHQSRQPHQIRLTGNPFDKAMKQTALDILDFMADPRTSARHLGLTRLGNPGTLRHDVRAHRTYPEFISSYDSAHRRIYLSAIGSMNYARDPKRHQNGIRFLFQAATNNLLATELRQHQPITIESLRETIADPTTSFSRMDLTRPYLPRLTISHGIDGRYTASHSQYHGNHTPPTTTADPERFSNYLNPIESQKILLSVQREG